MLLVVKIRLTSQFVGELSPDHTGVRRFRRATGGNIAIQAASWQEQFRLAAHHLKISLDEGTIHPPKFLLPASIHLLRRHFNKIHVNLFESFRSGTILTMDFVIDDQSRRSPSLDQFTALLSFVGQHLGLSPWGNKFGFGRFDVIEVKPITYQNFTNEPQTCQSPGAGTQGGSLSETGSAGAPD